VGAISIIVEVLPMTELPVWPSTVRLLSAVDA